MIGDNDDITDKDLEDLLKMIDQIDDSESNIDYDLVMNTFGLDLKDLEKDMGDYTPTLDLFYAKSNENSVDPKYNYQSDSGFGLYSIEEFWIHPFDRKSVKTGIHFDIPEGYEIQVRSDSELALNQGLMVLNSPGTIDQRYTGEIKIILFNTTKEKVKINKNQKLAQAVLCPVVSGKWVKLIEKNKIDKKDQNKNGFGLTGL